MDNERIIFAIELTNETEFPDVDKENDKWIKDNINTKIESMNAFKCSCGDCSESGDDDYEYRVLAITDHGKYVELVAIIQQCKHCGNIRINGDIDWLTKITGLAIMDLVECEQSLAEDGDDIYEDEENERKCEYQEPDISEEMGENKTCSGCLSCSCGGNTCCCNMPDTEDNNG